MAKAPSKTTAATENTGTDTAENNTGKTDATFTEQLLAVGHLPALAALLAATEAGNFLYMSDDAAKPFIDVDMAEVNSEMVNPDAADEFATRLTEKGVAYAKANPATPSADHSDTSEKSSDGNKRQSTGFVRPKNIEVDDNVPMPARTRGRTSNSEEAYPFSKLEIGQSFHIAATEAAPDPAKSVASSVSTANAKYREDIKGEDGKPVLEEVTIKHRGKSRKETRPKQRQLRLFSLFAVGENDPKGPGCRVYRVELDDEAEDDSAEG